MENLSLESAYARYGAKVSSRLRCLSAIAADGSLVLTCHSERFSRPGIGILRYTTQLSADKLARPKLLELQTQIAAALNDATPVRLVIVTAAQARRPRSIHVRTDLPGQIMAFDGDSYTVDFTRPPAPPVEPKVRRKR